MLVVAFNSLVFLAICVLLWADSGDDREKGVPPFFSFAEWKMTPEKLGEIKFAIEPAGYHTLHFFFLSTVFSALFLPFYYYPYPQQLPKSPPHIPRNATINLGMLLTSISMKNVKS